MAKVDIEQDAEVNEGLKKKENSAEVTEVTDVPEISEVSTVATPTDEDNAGLPSLADNKVSYPTKAPHVLLLYVKSITLTTNLRRKSFSPNVLLDNFTNTFAGLSRVFLFHV
tara:strand:+ start:1969 stop:2304 length:336 start_codon:yes stop_codon:yes gene_type:complete